MKKVMVLNADFSVNDYTLNANFDKNEQILRTDVTLGGGGGTSDYRKLKNKPSINGTELYDNYDEVDPTVHDWAKTETKPEYTAEEIGAVDVNNELHFDEIDRMFNAVFGLK